MYQQLNGYQPGFNHGTNYHGPPPAKKVKNNPIITHYPPPPGYIPPPQLQTPSAYPGHGWTQPGYQSYPQQIYAAPQAYQWPPQQQQPYVHPGYPASQIYYPQSPSYSSHGWQQPTSAPISAPHHEWQSHTTTYHQDGRPSSSHSQQFREVSVGLLDGNGELMASRRASESDDWEDDYDGEYYFARHPDEINPDLSIGWIVWQAPLPITHPLPPTYAEAELEALAPRKAKLDDEPSISEYFTRDRVEESLVSVRQTTAWDEVKDDLIYRILPAVCRDVVKLPELLEKYRDRPDPMWNAPRPVEVHSNYDALSSFDAMEVDSHHDSPAYTKSEEVLEQDDILSNLERAVSAGDGRGRRSSETRLIEGSGHSRAASVASSTAGERITRPKALAPIRDHAQEDILAALGVTGSPKFFYQTPGPATSVSRPSSQQRDDVTSRPNSAGVKYGPSRPPPPPPQHQRLPGLFYAPHRNGYAAERPSSSSSHRTVSGSDFQPDDLDATPRPKMNGNTGRKRSHYEVENGGLDVHDPDEDNDSTPKQRSKHARMNSISQ
ncbi:hypothetical protein LTR49_008190 [Elasticomyces elasticus]|nr:hypothetical protein LTR49_008190 [Elasticomyces elasticus]